MHVGRLHCYLLEISRVRLYTQVFSRWVFNLYPYDRLRQTSGLGGTNFGCCRLPDINVGAPAHRRLHRFELMMTESDDGQSHRGPRESWGGER